MYYTTPHSTTGKTPTELLYGKTIRSKIPSLGDIATAPPVSDYRDRDQLLKEKVKACEDEKRRAMVSDIVVGDKVLMKNLLPGNKLQTPFGPTEYIVKRKTGASVVIEDSDGVQYERNVSHLKKVQKDADDADVTPGKVHNPQPGPSRPRKRKTEFQGGVVTRARKRREEKKRCGSESEG
uniref:Uncharacterized protein n=1 Tax=Lutzomyia longipalpis TaxID=7200 RepID=A0A1B0CLD0_LUTLO